MTLSVLEGHPLLQAISSAIFRICGTLRRPSASAELLVKSGGPVSSTLVGHRWLTRDFLKETRCEESE